jgi:hypothetical protein
MSDRSSRTSRGKTKTRETNSSISRKMSQVGSKITQDGRLSGSQKRPLRKSSIRNNSSNGKTRRTSINGSRKNGNSSKRLSVKKSTKKSSHTRSKSGSGSQHSNEKQKSRNTTGVSRRRSSSNKTVSKEKSQGKNIELRKRTKREFQRNVADLMNNSQVRLTMEAKKSSAEPAPAGNYSQKHPTNQYILMIRKPNGKWFLTSKTTFGSTTWSVAKVEAGRWLLEMMTSAGRLNSKSHPTLQRRIVFALARQNQSGAKIYYSRVYQVYQKLEKSSITGKTELRNTVLAAKRDGKKQKAGHGQSFGEVCSNKILEPLYKDAEFSSRFR